MGPPPGGGLGTLGVALGALAPVALKEYMRGQNHHDHDDDDKKARGGRAARKSGGKALVADFANRDDKAANEERDGIKHQGGMRDGGRTRARKMIGGSLGMLSPVLMAANALRDKDKGDGHKRGGRAKKADGGNAGDMVPTSRMAFTSGSSHLSKGLGLKRGGAVADGVLEGTRPTGGRIARKDGGRAGKGKVNVNIIIGEKSQAAPPAPHPMLPPIPMGPPPGMGAGPPPMPPMPPPGMGPNGPGGPPPGLPPMPRKRGGRTSLDAGAGSGPGRLEKIELQGRKR